MVRFFALALASAGGAGFAPVAPGTFGAALGVLGFVAWAPGGLGPVLFSAALLFAIGTWASSEAERCFARADDGRIVIDEVAGQLLALCPLVMAPGAGREREPLWLLAGFVLFRVFDIWKPGPVRWAERHFQGGLGVMADDGVAGILGAIALAALLACAEGMK